MSKETPSQSLDHLPTHTLHCPECTKEFPCKFAPFGQSSYKLIGCETCPSLLALPEIDPIVLYLEGKFDGREQELQGAIARGLMACHCGGRFRVFDDKRRCPLCRAVLKEVQFTGQVAGLGPEMVPIPGKLFSVGSQVWAHLDFLRHEIESLAHQYEASPMRRVEGKLDDRWLAKEIYDTHIRKIKHGALLEFMPQRGDLFVFNQRIYHDHGGARGPWWKFWDRRVLYPEKCGIVFDIDLKQFRCAGCAKTFPAKVG